jgi:hypothetical protein
MYPRLADWLEIRESLDPDGVFGSDLACRLGIAGGRRPVMVKAKA